MGGDGEAASRVAGDFTDMCDNGEEVGTVMVGAGMALVRVSVVVVVVVVVEDGEVLVTKVVFID